MADDDDDDGDGDGDGDDDHSGNNTNTTTNTTTNTNTKTNTNTNTTTNTTTITQLVAIDFPGHGRSSHHSSDHPPNMVVSDFVYYVAEAVRALQWQSSTTTAAAATATTSSIGGRGGGGFVLIGHSMGGIISTMYAAAFPEQVQRLILLDSYGPDMHHKNKNNNNNNNDTNGRHPHHKLSHLIQRHVQLRLAQGAKRKVYHSLGAAVQTRLQTARNCPGNQYLSPQAARKMVEWAIINTKKNTINTNTNNTINTIDTTQTSGTVTVIASLQLQFRHDPRLSQCPPLQLHSIEQVDDYWSNIKCPTLWLRAKTPHGWPYPPKLLARAKAQLGDKGTVVLLPGSHHFHADPETANAVAETVLNYLSSTTTTTTTL